MPFHGKHRQDFVIWRTTYSGIQPEQFDLENPDHEEKLGHGRAIMFFTCKVRASELLPVEIKHLVFMEEVWRYTAPKADYLTDEYKCHRFYSTRPNPAYYVVDIDHILGPAALFRCPVNPCIPPSGLRVARHNPSAVSETKTGD